MSGFFIGHMPAAIHKVVIYLQRFKITAMFAYTLYISDFILPCESPFVRIAAMTCCLMFRNDTSKCTSRFYRVEISANLFQEFSVLREWGKIGGKGQQIIRLFPDLRSASLAADTVREAKLRRGYMKIWCISAIFNNQLTNCRDADLVYANDCLAIKIGFCAVHSC